VLACQPCNISSDLSKEMQRAIDSEVAFVTESQLFDNCYFVSVDLNKIKRSLVDNLTSFIKDLDKACNWSDPTLAVATHKAAGRDYAVVGIFTRDFQRFVISQYLMRKQLRLPSHLPFILSVGALDKSLTTEIS